MIPVDEVASFLVLHMRPFDAWPHFPRFVHTGPAPHPPVGRKDIRPGSRPGADDATPDEDRQAPADRQ